MTRDHLTRHRPVFPAVIVTSSTVPSSSSTSTAVLGGSAAGLPPPPLPPIVYRGGDRFYPGGSIHHHHDHHQSGTAAPTLPHVPPPAIYPAHPHQPQQPIHNGPPSSITPPKTSTGQKKKNSTYRVVTVAPRRRPSVRPSRPPDGISFRSASSRAAASLLCLRIRSESLGTGSYRSRNRSSHRAQFAKVRLIRLRFSRTRMHLA